jgi:protein-tyrosine phosphatase
MGDRAPRILTVCAGNICRSPAAEAAIREAAALAGVDVVVDSAGTGAWHAGEAPDSRMREAGAAGLDVTGRARRIDPSDFDAFDLIVAMDRSNLDHLVRMAPSPQAAKKVELFLSFAPSAGTMEVPDPYYGGPEGFERVVRLVRAAARGLVETIVRP